MSKLVSRLVSRLPLPVFDAPPWRLSGTVYGVALNDPQALAAIGDAVRAPPYKAPPAAPVLYVKPRNTLAASGATFAADGDVFGLGATLALVIGRATHAVPAARALAQVAGCLLVADLSLPHGSYYRPAVSSQARDGSCVLGSRVAAVDPDAAVLQVMVDGVHVQRIALHGHVRGAAQLLADVSAFMTLAAGDLLLLGTAHGAPLVGAGQRWSIEAEGLGSVEGRLQ